MKKTISLLCIAVFMIGMLAACGKDSKTDSSPSGAATAAPAQATDAPATTEAPATAAPVEPVTLAVAGFKGGQEIGNMEELNKKFEQENPGITIKYDFKPGAEYKPLLTAKSATKDLPDVMMIWPAAGMAPFVKANNFMDLSGEPWAADILDKAKSVTTFNGKLYGLPNDMAALGVFYNIALFEKLGIAIPKTYAEFLIACNKLKTGGIIPLAFGKDINLDNYTIAPSFVYAKNPKFDDEMNAGNATFSGVYNDMVTTYTDLYKKYATKDAAGKSFDATQAEFTNEKAGMWIFGSWQLAALKTANPGLQIGMFPFPNKEGEVWASAAVGTVWAINQDTKHADAAKKYLAFWANPENQNGWAKSQTSFTTTTKGDAGLDAGLKPISDAIAAGNFWRFLDQGWDNPTLVGDLGDATNKVIFGKATVEEALKVVDEKHKQFLSQKK